MSRRTCKLKVGDTVISTVEHRGAVTKGKRYIVQVAETMLYGPDRIWITCDDGINRHGDRDIFLSVILNLNKRTKVI